MKRFILCTITIFAFSVACKKDELLQDQFIKVYYSVLQCEPYPWNNGELVNESTNAINLGHYLDEKYLYRASIEMVAVPGAQCAACGCPPVHYVCVTTFESLEAEYLKIGFVKK
jgi:hypothetical protein